MKSLAMEYDVTNLIHTVFSQFMYTAKKEVCYWWSERFGGHVKVELVSGWELSLTQSSTHN
jgi:hypothetical protein